MQPTRLQDDEHIGVATVLLRTGTDFYTHVRFPAIGEDLANQVARDTASLTAAPDRPQLVAVQ